MKVYEVFKESDGGYRAVKRGFSWPSFFFSWLWALTRGLWLEAVGTLVMWWAANLLGFGLSRVALPLKFLPVLVFHAWCGFRGNFWLGRRLERLGWNRLGAILARDRNDAVAKVAACAGVIPAELAAKPASAGVLPVPRSLQAMLAIVSLTWKAAFRYRLFWVVLGLLLVAIIGLPLLVKHDGTAGGFAQISITYALGSVTVLLGLCTLWLACGTLARDVEECQIQVVAVKPIARWQIWLGKWLGLVSLNAALLATAALSIYTIIEWRSNELVKDGKQDELIKLRTEVLVARGSAREEGIMDLVSKETEKRYQEQIAKTGLSGAQAQTLHDNITKQVMAEVQSVSPGRDRIWAMHLSVPKSRLKGEPIYLRVKFNTSESPPHDTYDTVWMYADPKGERGYTETKNLTPDSFHEFPINSDVLDDQGNFLVRFANPSGAALLFPIEDGMEALYRVGGFGINLVRAMGIILCWMSLFAALGLAAASFLSFPVAAFCSLAALSIGLSSGTLSAVVSEGTVLGMDQESGQLRSSVVDSVLVPVFGATLKVINLVQQFSPVDSLSTGREISWRQLGRAVCQVVFLLGGILAAFGIYVFHRRELATAQGNQ